MQNAGKMRYKKWLAAWLLTGLLCVPAQLCSQEQQTTTVQFVPLTFQNAEHSDQFRSKRLAERFRQVAAGAIPRRKNSWTVHLELCDAKEVQHFEVKPASSGKRELLVKVPLAFDSWRDDVLAHNWLMSVLLLAQLGEDFDKDGHSKAHLVQGHWLVLGLARRSAGDTLFTLRPFARSYAMAYVFCANGLVLPLRQVVSGRGEAGRDLVSAAELESEYAGLLVDACESAGYFRNGLAEPALRHAIRSTDADLWQDFLRSGTANNLFSGRDPEEWFRAHLERRLLSMLSPLSVEYFETSYQELTTLTYKGSDGSEETCGLSGLVENWEYFSSPNSLIDDLQLKLHVLSFRAPAGLQQPLSAVRQALTGLRTERTPERQKHLFAAEQQLFDGIRKRIDLEQFLRQAEQRHISPGNRFQRTLRAAGMARSRDRSLLPAVQKKLDEWDDYQ